MKNSIIVFILAISAVLAGCKHKKQELGGANSADIKHNSNAANNNADASELPKVQFENVEHDFGIILQGEKVTHSFKFKNTGTHDLIVNDASASCGCTVPKFTSDPIAPGEQGEIEVVFNSANRTGRQVKTITVWTNCQPSQTKLQITSEIVVPK